MAIATPPPTLGSANRLGSMTAALPSLQAPSMVVTAPRRKRFRRWKLGAVVVVVIGLTAALGYVGYQAALLDGQVKVLTTANASLFDQKTSLEQTNSQQTSDIARLRTELAHPTLTQWTACKNGCTMGPTSWRVAGVPDTFKLLVSYTATTPVAVYFMTFPQYIQFVRCGSWDCVYSKDSKAGWYPPSTSLTNGVFDEAEGCSGYVVVFKSTGYGTITPNVRVTYQPADHATGVCAG
jgi:hypothetical protein